MTLIYEKFWTDKIHYDDAERKYNEFLSKETKSSVNISVLSDSRNQDSDKTKLKKEKMKKKKLEKKKLLQQEIENINSVDKENEVNPKNVDIGTTKKNKKSKHKIKDDKLDCAEVVGGQCSLSSEISKARQHIKNSLERMDGIALPPNNPNNEMMEKINVLEKENLQLKEVMVKLELLTIKLSNRVDILEKELKKDHAFPENLKTTENEKDNEDDDVDLFGEDSEGEDDKAAELREQRLAEYAAKKSKKPALIAKSNVILDIKPWDDETDMQEMETEVRKITADGLLMGASKLVPLAYGIHKLQLSVVIEDDKISVDWLTEEIEKIEQYVQSVDIAAFNKI